MFKGFKIWVFGASAVVYLGLIIGSFLINFAIDDGRTVSHAELFVARLFTVLQYPIWLISNQDTSETIALFALAINTCCYAFVIERIIFVIFFRRQLKVKEG